MDKKAKKILLVDDDEIQLSFIETMLKKKYDVIAIKSSEEALGYLYRGLVPGLIVLDILMPRMDGWEMFNRIRAISLLRNVPVVFLTSLQGTDEEKRGRAMGAADYITKPFNETELMERIKTVLEDHEKKQSAG
ncbi:MAG: response regulator [Spirochaetaceae bacterium]|jgi:DNA-binding response OmpR family regulator|nr:response regulator [Spirochaetaceae bacterium]